MNKLRYISTNGKSEPVTFSEAVFRGLADDGGLYMPEQIPLLPELFWHNIGDHSWHEIIREMVRPFLKGEFDGDRLDNVISDVFTFDAPLIQLNNRIFILELFHGPTLAFKDFGARFMARIFAGMGYNSDNVIGILVATSGDTGSAVAQGFRDIEGVRVFLLYPQGKVSHLQEQQITTAGGNVTAIEVDGSFDDCQRMVKQAFADADLRSKFTLTSANSINIARLLPQSFYYAYGFSQYRKVADDVPAFSVPSGNIGNLTGGLLAMKMGMPVDCFLAAVNANKVVPDYLAKGKFSPKDSVRTISNAMDVGNPSNLSRVRYLFNDDIDEIRHHIKSYSFTDDETRSAISEVFRKYRYVMDPHTAVGYLAGQLFTEKNPAFSGSIIVMATAHPAKFIDTVEPIIGQPVAMPERLKICLEKTKKTVKLSADYNDFKKMLETYMIRKQPSR